MDVSNSSPISVALKGLQKEFQKISENASKVAGFSNTENSPSTVDLAEPLLEINQSMRQVEALTKVIKVTQETEDEVLDIIA